jgi:bifunctional ADP-heptose synthase (sugar kinase/adenylyltransferase)
VDTRKKILTVEEAGRLSGPIALVTGEFDVLRASHIRDLEDVRNHAPKEAALLVAVLPAPGALLAQQARAELVAALRMVDYVVTADPDTADRLSETLMCFPILRMSTADASRGRELKEHVRSRQK